ncbi:hypothetical protein GCM10007269_14710 [Microbacterium murale]|uniref:DUF3054 domain-containing protein n=2 Tax=Microbacterium murale TaxID=1081040 RepID=A0ABQ1RK84_9MICO|nr:hypothetical protein GCM10007269_14710 [Microbacterium murale]
MPIALIIVIDVILVAVFCVIGRLSHAEGVFSDIPGLLGTTWPFLVAVLAAHAVMLIRRTPADRMLPGVVIWAVTVVVGLVLRALSGQGTAIAFMIVATLTLALFLIGWRAVVALTRWMRRRRLA